MGSINDEWFRKPFSRLEKTLRFPVFLKFALILFVTRILPVWVLASTLVWFVINKAFLAAGLGFLFTLIRELYTLETWYRQLVLPRHKENMRQVRAINSQFKSKSPKELVSAIEHAINRASWGTINIGYVGVAAWGWEIILRLVYPLIIKSTNIPYSDLLVGFPNKSTEADQKLWEVAQIDNAQKRKIALDTYLNNYGSRAEDVDLAYPTFRERTQTVKNLLDIYGQTSAPDTAVAKAVIKRKAALIALLAKLRVPKGFFLNLVAKVQRNVVLREDRRFYEFEGDWYLRQMLFHLAKLTSIDQEKLFTLSWQEIKNAANKR